MLNIKNLVCSILLINCVLIVNAVKSEELYNNIIEERDNNVTSYSKLSLENRESIQMAENINLQKFDMRYSTLPKICGNYAPPKDCAEATSCTNRSGIYMIENIHPFYVECDDDTMGGDWLVIQRRQDGSVDFYRDWIEYEQGFGNIDEEFWIGLKNLYALTNLNGPQELIIIMEDYNLTSAYAKYDFYIGNASEMYELKELGQYSGTAGNSLFAHLGRKFSTRDRDNDLWVKGSCAQDRTGAWWYYHCSNSNLNGKYGHIDTNKGIHWYGFGVYNSRKYVKMMIRRRKN